MTKFLFIFNLQPSSISGNFERISSLIYDHRRNVRSLKISLNSNFQRNSPNTRSVSRNEKRKRKNSIKKTTFSQFLSLRHYRHGKFLATDTIPTPYELRTARPLKSPNSKPIQRYTEEGRKEKSQVHTIWRRTLNTHASRRHHRLYGCI